MIEENNILYFKGKCKICNEIGFPKDITLYKDTFEIINTCKKCGSKAEFSIPKEQVLGIILKNS